MASYEPNDAADRGPMRRHALECMLWAGTGVLWTLAGGVPRSLGLLGGAATAQAAPRAMTFLQVSDSHLGFDKEAGGTAVETFHVPGEHDVVDPGQGRACLNHYGKGTKGAGWQAFDRDGVHFIGLVNVVDLKAGGARIGGAPGSPGNDGGAGWCYRARAFTARHATAATTTQNSSRKPSARTVRVS